MDTLRRAIKNTAALAAADLFSKAINFVFIATLARSLSPAEFGGYTTVMALIWFVGPLCDIGISLILTREVAAEPRRAGILLTNALAITGGISLLGSLVMIAIAGLANYPDELRPLIAFSGLAVIGNTLTQTTASVLRGLERMEIPAGLSSAVLLLSSLAGIVAALTLQELNIQVWIVVVASLLGAAAALGLVHRFFVPIRNNLDWKVSKTLIGQSLPVAVLLLYSLALRWFDVLILGQSRTLSEVAVYSTAIKVIDLAAVFSSSASMVLFTALSNRWRVSASETQRLFIRSLRFFAALGLSASLGIIVLAEPLILWVFGETYFASILPLRILGAAFFFQVISGPTGYLLIAAGDKLKKFIPLLGSVVLLNVSLNLVLAPLWGPIGSATAFLVTAIGTFLVRQWIAQDYFERPPRMIELLWRPMLAGAAMAFLLYLLPPLHLLLKVPIGAAAFLVALWLMREFKEQPYRSIIEFLGEIFYRIRSAHKTAAGK